MKACAICQGPARPSGLCHYCEAAMDDMDKAENAPKCPHCGHAVERHDADYVDAIERAEQRCLVEGCKCPQEPDHD